MAAGHYLSQIQAESEGCKRQRQQDQEAQDAVLAEELMRGDQEAADYSLALCLQAEGEVPGVGVCTPVAQAKASSSGAGPSQAPKVGAPSAAGPSRALSSTSTWPERMAQSPFLGAIKHVPLQSTLACMA